MFTITRRSAAQTSVRAAASPFRASSSSAASSSTSPSPSTTPPPPSAAAPPTTPRPRRRRGASADDYDPTKTDLVAPPDPLSNMRPVLYASPHRRPSNSPYSAAEFPASMTGSAAAQAEREMAWTMMRERVDIANHRFWAGINADFEAHRAARLAALPPAADPPTPEDEAAREAVLSQFYRDWQIGTRERQAAWVRQWWGDVWAGIKVQARVYLGRWV